VEQNLVGRVAIVTGATEGIGFAAARRLAGAGARVTIVDVDADGARRAAERIGQDEYTDDAQDFDISASWRRTPRSAA
jgi:3-hydroxybutyrate dehydrogenase